MSEEIENPALNIPRAILTTMLLNGTMGFAMLLAVLFCLGDPESVLVRPCHSLKKIEPYMLHRCHLPASHSFKYSMMESNPKPGQR